MTPGATAPGNVALAYLLAFFMVVAAASNGSKNSRMLFEFIAVQTKSFPIALAWLSAIVPPRLTRYWLKWKASCNLNLAMLVTSRFIAGLTASSILHVLHVRAI